MAIFGWDTLKMAEQYTRSADQRRLAQAAMHMLESGRTDQNGIESHLRVQGDNPDQNVSKINPEFSGWCPGEDSNLHASRR